MVLQTTCDGHAGEPTNAALNTTSVIMSLSTIRGARIAVIPYDHLTSGVSQGQHKMAYAVPPSAPSVPIHQVKQWINQRTWGRLRDLGVERKGDRVIVHGHALSYYHKQLALAAAMERVLPERLVIDIDVTPANGRAI
jgi:hypothetical protein